MQWWVLRRRPHISWLITILGVAFIIGIICAKYAPQAQFASTIWLLVGSICIITGLQYRYLYLIPGLVIGALLVGLWRGSAQVISLSQISQLYDTKTTLVGNVREDVDSDKSGQLIIRLDQLQTSMNAFDGSLWVTTKADVDIKRGDTVTVEGIIVKGFGSFVGTMYRAEIIALERPQPGDVARVVRDWFADAIRRAIPSPESSLGIGYLVGQKRALPLDLAEALQIAGLTHVVVASGYNLTILVRLARRLFEKVSKYLSALSASLMIVSFIAVTGLSPSMSRAGLVAGLSLAAWYYGRRFHPVVLLTFAAAVTVMVNPSYAWGDLGWQLSFTAFAGVMILAPLLQRFFFGDSKPSTIRQILGETSAALIMTAPILMYSFGQLSNVALIANLLVLPLVPLAMLLTFIAGIGALALPAFAVLIGLPASWLLGYMINTANYLADIPWAVSEVEFSLTGVIVSYVVLLTVCIVLSRVTRYDLRDSNIVE